MIPVRACGQRSKELQAQGFCVEELGKSRCFAAKRHVGELYNSSLPLVIASSPALCPGGNIYDGGPRFLEGDTPAFTFQETLHRRGTRGRSMESLKSLASQNFSTEGNGPLEPAGLAVFI